MNRTKIEYLDYTWNPIAMRCCEVSDGCKNCWHLRMCRRIAGNKSLLQFRRECADGTMGPMLDPVELYAPLHKKKPARIGVQFMGDLFTHMVDFSVIRDVHRIMRRAPHHTYVVLTKRPERMLEWWRINYEDSTMHRMTETWPRLWLGVSAENQKMLDERLPILMAIPAAVRFVSIEPMLTRVHLSPLDDLVPDWVICGPETGPGKRPCDPKWIGEIASRCSQLGIRFFDKRADPIRREFPR